MTAVGLIESDYTWLLVCVNYAIWLVLSSTCHFLTDDSLQSADKDQQEMRAVTEKPRDVVVKFDTYRNLHRHRAVLPAIARLLYAKLLRSCTHTPLIGLQPLSWWSPSSRWLPLISAA